LDGPLGTATVTLGVPPVPVFLRWLLVDIIVMRILRHRRVRPYLDRAYPAVSQYTTRFGRRVYPTMARGYRSVRRRPRFSCCSGCLLMVLIALLGLVGLFALVHWTVSL
ncbi:MAG: hypothetical protein M3070_09370, partial [Actinomycetota bacterium]|nr:hypothetical protein [Actinomycetota bacterium]